MHYGRVCVLVALCGLLLSGCSLGTDLIVSNPCDSPLLVRLSYSGATAEERDSDPWLHDVDGGAVPAHGSAFVARPEDVAGGDYPWVIWVDEAGYRGTVTYFEARDKKPLQLPTSICDSLSDLSQTVVWINPVGGREGTRFQAAGPPQAMDALERTAGSLAGTDVDVSRTADNAMRITLWPSEGSTAPVPALLTVLLHTAPPLHVVSCSTSPSACDEWILTEGQQAPQISLPKGERPNALTDWGGRILWSSIILGVLAWAIHDLRRRHSQK